MIRLENLSKSFPTRWGRKVVIDSAVIRGESEPLLVYENKEQQKAASDE